MSLADVFKEILADGLINETLNCCSRWSARRRIMGEPFSGPYGWKYHPWAKEMLDSQASFNYSMKAAQLGMTEVGINRAFYTLDQKMRDVLYVLPTALNASDFSKARFSVALKHSPYLKSLFTDTNTVNLKQAGTCTLYIRGSRGDSNLKSIPVSEMILDEVDEMDQKQVWLALERLSGQLRKCVWGISTPTIPNYGIHKLFQTSTQEHFVFECPCCSRTTELIWPDCVEIIGESVNDIRCKESYLKCKECGGKLNHEDKPNWLGKTGRFQQMAMDADPDIRGFHVNQLYSFTVSPGELVVAHFRGTGDEAAESEFYKSKLGLPFIGEGAQVTDDQLDEAVTKHGVHTTDESRPNSGYDQLITMGVDQGKWNYYTVCEWYFDKLAKDLNVSAFCKVIGYGKFFEDDYWMLDELMAEWQVRMCVIDADPQINEARRFSKRFDGFVHLCRYRSGKVGKEIVVSDEDRAPMATVDRTNWLTASLGRFRSKRIALPRDISLEYREHMKALVRTYTKDELNNPVATFAQTGPDHYAHSLNYSEIALPLAASTSTGKDIESFL